MNSGLAFALNVVAISIVVFGLYFRRHHRRDMIVALLTVNLGVLAAVSALRSSDVPDTLGFGLFGILSIIRLRSSELEQQGVAYYFAALSLGVLAGLPVSPTGLAPALMGAIVVGLWIGDHPALFADHRRQHMVLDRAFTDEAELTRYLGELLNARIRHVQIERVDLVRETTAVEVRYQFRVEHVAKSRKRSRADKPPAGTNTVR